MELTSMTPKVPGSLSSQVSRVSRFPFVLLSRSSPIPSTAPATAPSPSPLSTFALRLFSRPFNLTPNPHNMPFSSLCPLSSSHPASPHPTPFPRNGPFPFIFLPPSRRFAAAVLPSPHLFLDQKRSGPNRISCAFFFRSRRTSSRLADEQACHAGPLAEGKVYWVGKAFFFHYMEKLLLAMSRHGGGSLGRDRVLAPPKRSRRLREGKRRESVGALLREASRPMENNSPCAESRTRYRCKKNEIPSVLPLRTLSPHEKTHSFP